ncbi:hypothetical protein [Collimonas antrihumi]|uniref:hypothetical protein n=1 Tax=Collimonas antrihumi TaxID=1940615 RepID=UPI001B8D5C20|nr:hypothetical protein [Collimonas antrihumi]
MFYVLTLVPVLMVVIAIYRYWVSVRRIGYFDEVVRRAPNWLPLDGVAVGAAGFVAYYAAMNWWGFTIPMLNTEPLPAWANMFMAVLSCFACMGLAYFNAGMRFDRPSWIGMRESAIRSVAALRVIDALELARLLEIARQNEAKSGHVIEGEDCEVRK